MTGNQLPLALLSSCLVFACGSAEPADEADASVSSDGVGTSNATGAGGAASSTASTGTAHTATSTTTSSGGSGAVSSASGSESTSTSTSQTATSSGGSGETTSSSTTGADNPCPNLPVNCVPLCEAGVCQCDCSARGSCATPGWIESALSWEQLGLADQAGAGVTLCHPDTFTWSDPAQSPNAPSLNGSPSITFRAYAPTDPVNALKYLSDQDAAHCNYELLENYSVRFLSVDDWPAMEQFYMEPAPVCGACDPLPEARLNLVGNFYLAAGSLVLATQAVADTESGLSIGILFDIAETIRVDTGDAAGDTSADVAALHQRHQDSCGG